MVISERMTERSKLIVQELEQDASVDWDAFVRHQPGGLPTHLCGWRAVIQKTYGYKTRFLMVLEDDQIRGVCPLFIVPSYLTGKRIMSMPGGICAVSAEAAVELLRSSAEITEDEGLNRAVIQDSREMWSGGWQVQSEHVYWLLSLPETEELLWSQLDGNIRRQVRKARKNGLRAEVDRTGSLLPAFYEMFSRFTHQVGTPIFSYQFLENVIQTFPGRFNIALVWHKKTPVAGYFQLEMGDTMYGMWGAALPQTLNLRSAYLALWEIMSDAIDHGFAYLDMGRSPAGSNASKFKGQWGGTSAPVYQLSKCENGRLEGETITNQVKSDQRFQLFIQLWPRLPFSLTKRLGPKLRWHIPFA
jgi:FemAB-related protein (PEP-CTERM system-associated)